MERVSRQFVFNGWHEQYAHQSSSLNCQMRFAIFTPPNAHKATPVVYWLSGLTCNDENFMQKAGAQRIAAELGIILVAPDTSPRGADVADDKDAAYDLGLGAGFYINATQEPWQPHYQMYDYIVHELPRLIHSLGFSEGKTSIMGHSMGGHGALMIALKNSNQYASASAFSPICHPSDCPWGQKAFKAYLGNDESQWAAYDTTLLMKLFNEKAVPFLIDQGADDAFLETQLRPEALISAAKEKEYPLEYRQHNNYDHSYYFIASFIEDHLQFHMKHLRSS